MANIRRICRQGKPAAHAVLIGVMANHPRGVTLPRERERYARLVIDVLGKQFEVHAYGALADASCQLLEGTQVRAVCDLVMEMPPSNPSPNGSPKMHLDLRDLRMIDRPEEVL